MLTKVLHKKKPNEKCQEILKNCENFIQLFRERANNNPNHIAVRTRDDSLTYQELDQKSDVLASYLKKVGVKTEDLVGLCSSLTTDFIVSLLGILKAGAVYFPLDPNYPRAELEYILDEGKPATILVEAQYKNLFFHTRNKIVEIGSHFLNTIDIDEEVQNYLLHPDNLAYVIYTSGSTGKPKGILVTHRSLINIALAHNDYYPSNMKMLVAGGVCFDASLLVIFHALANNESLYLFNYNATDSADNLLNFIETNSINYMICVPSQYMKILQKKRPLDFLKCVSLTGEPFPKSLCELHVNLAPNALLYNEYGPSECAIGTTISKIYDPIQRIIRNITVGKPLANTEVYILDHELNSVSKGSKGEIFIAGVGLARGYLNNESLTSKKFIKVKFQSQKEMRLYRTGDIGRILPNGELEFLGRINDEIQISGNQINLGEIECHIAKCSQIQEFAVLCKTVCNEKKLVVYYTSTKKNASAKLLLKLFNNLLPNDITPSIVHVDKFPILSNGKIDRNELVRLYG